MAAEDVNSAEQALTLEFYARFLKERDRASEAEPIVARATEIRKARAAALGPMRTSASNALKVGGSVKQPSLLSKVEPEYSEDARAAKFQGTVLLQIVVDADGLATDIKVAKSLGFGLDEKAVEAVQRWKFKPGTIGDTPVPVMATIEINFRLM
jgi:TonB family protein